VSLHTHTRTHTHTHTHTHVPFLTRDKIASLQAAEEELEGEIMYYTVHISRYLSMNTSHVTT